MSLYKQPNSEVWWYNLSHAGERVRKSTGEVDQRKAQRVHDEARAELWNRPTLKGRTWGGAVLLWCAASPRSDSELLSLAKFARVYKDRLIADVTRESVHTALAFCKTAGTYTRYRTMIAAILNAAKQEGWLREVPKLVSRTDKKAKPRKWLSHEEWARLHAELPPHMQRMAQFAVETGLRQANVLGLTWSCVDLERKLVWVEGAETKSGAALAVPLSQGALDVLHSVVGQHKTYVFTYRGAPTKEIKTAFLAACRRAEVPGFTWHGLRHTWATWHVQNGTPLDVLQKLGGWSDLRMVMNYSHHSAGHLASFADNARKEK